MKRPFVVHCEKMPYDVYIGRPSSWGNRYTHIPSRVPGVIRVSCRETAIELYEKWLLAQPELVAQIKRELRGKVLGCWCAPLPCHGDVLTRIANE